MVAALVVAGVAFCATAYASFDDGAQAYRVKDYEAAVAEWQPLAEEGDRAAQFGLAVSYEHGHGVPRDLSLAAHWYRKAAERGLTTAQFKLGNLYFTGRGVPKDEQEALRWHRRAADSGLPIAQMNLAYAYEVGAGVEKDLLKAAHWYQQAAAQGAVWAQDRLAVLYAQGVSPAAMPLPTAATADETLPPADVMAESEDLSRRHPETQDLAKAFFDARIRDEQTLSAPSDAGLSAEEEAEPAEIEIARSDVSEVEPVAVKADEPTAPSLAESIRIRLASYRDRAKAEKGWHILSHRYNDLLGSLSYTLEPIDLGPKKGKFLRLEAGPLTSLAQASELCAEIERRGGDECVTVRP